MKYVNEEEKFWKHSFRVRLHEHDMEGILINADNEQDALDYAFDHAEEQGWEGLFIDPKEEENFEQLVEWGEIIFAGNHCRPVDTTIIKIEQLD